MTPDELEAEAMKLDEAARGELVRRLTASLPAAPGSTPSPASAPPHPDAPPKISDEEKERLWLQDALRRSRELRERQIQTEPPDSRGVFRPPTRVEGSERTRARPNRRRPPPKKRPAPKRRAATKQRTTAGPKRAAKSRSKSPAKARPKTRRSRSRR